MARPSLYTKDLGDRICEQLALGFSLRTVCNADSMPAVRTVFYWLRTYPDFLQQYARAKQESADAMADDILDIADNSTNDFMEIEYGGQTRTVVDKEAVQRSHIRIETRKWLMSKMKPKKYGDKLDLTTLGEKLPTPILSGASVAPVTKSKE